MASSEQPNSLRIALDLRTLINEIRSSYPDIHDFLQNNPNALGNIILVWKNQVTVRRNVYGTMVDMRVIPTIHGMFVFVMVAVIHPDFLDESLNEFIQKSGDKSQPMKYLCNHQDVLKKNCESDTGFVFYSGNIREILELLTKECTSSDETRFKFQYSLKSWSIFFGTIDRRQGFEEYSLEVEGSSPIFLVFGQLVIAFFKELEKSFQDSFQPFANFVWSENITRLCTTEIDNLISHVVPIVAYNMGRINNHAYLKREIDSKSKDISPACYASIFFPAFKRYIIIHFIRDFWEIHQKSVKPMNDLDFLRWLSSIPAYASYLKSSLDLIDALMHGTALPSITDGSSCDHSWLCPTNSAPSWSSSDEFDYQKHFIGLMGRNLEIEDFARIAPK